MKYTYQFYTENVEKTNTTYNNELGMNLFSYSQLKLYPVLYDKDKNEKFLNIFRSYDMNDETKLNDKIFKSVDLYECNDSDWFENISYRNYKRADLWWIVCRVNNIQNPFEDINPGQNLYIMNPSLLYQLYKEMDAISNLN